MMLEKWYGNKGIDTEYERYLISYRPNLIYPERESNYPLNRDAILQVSRSQDFLISRAMMDYRMLIEKIKELLLTIENRQSGNQFLEYLEHLNNKKLTDVFQVEDENSGHQGVIDYEIYTMLYYMALSLEERVVFLDEHFRVQITNETEDDKIFEAEKQSINEWVKKEYDVVQKYDELSHDGDNDRIEQEISLLEKERRKLDQLHTSMADISYVDRNRYLIFKDIVMQAEQLIKHPQTLIDGNLELLVSKISEMKDRNALQSHLILSFKEYKTRHSSLKQQYIMIDDKKEMFASERNYMYQQIVTQANDNVKEWLYEQPEDSGKSFDLFASFIVDSVEKTKKTYEESLADMLSFYKNEGSFYGRQILLLQKKEELRQFFRIVEDLEEIGDISDQWIKEYLHVQGYVG